MLRRCLSFIFTIPSGLKVFRAIKLKFTTTKQYHLYFSKSIGRFISCSWYLSSSIGSTNSFVSLLMHKTISKEHFCYYLLLIVSYLL